MAPKVLVTSILPPQTQDRLLQQDFELDQWQQDANIPRDELLKRVKGKLK
jgi:glyoxylate/hydroxypyruvate reductase